ncbi:MAG: hypothetical protein KC496_06710, partial [Anaerolineae bacterium]|nr:hypothetical protein [Anaerolineae bacterium]
GALQRQPAVLLMGSSRGLYVRSRMFTRQPDAFFNAAFSAATVYELRQFADMLAANDALPPVLLLQLDLPDFNGDKQEWRTGFNLPLDAASWEMNTSQLTGGVQTVGQRWTTEPARMMQIVQQNFGAQWPEYGLTIWQHNVSFFVDGSRYNARLTPENISRGIAEHQQELAQRSSRYEAGTTVDETAISHVDHILQLAADQGTQVIGYLPPFQQFIYQELSTADDFAYVPLAQVQLAQVFAAHGFGFYDFSDLDTIGGSDEEMYDGWHGGEQLEMRIVLSLAEAEPDVLSAYVDVSQLTAEIEAVGNPFYYYVERR